MVDEHADATRRSRSERVQLLVEVIYAVERLDDDALDAQVVAPDAFDQRRVVDALDPDPAGPGNPRPRRRRRERAGRGAGTFLLACGSHWPDEGHRPAVEQEGCGQQREVAPPAVTILERDGVAPLARVDGLPERDDRAAEPAVC